MRVALVCGTYAPERDGVADYVRRLSEELGRAGLDVVVAARADQDGSGPPDGVALAPGWSVRHLPPDAARVFRLLGLHPGLRHR